MCLLLTPLCDNYTLWCSHEQFAAAVRTFWRSRSCPLDQKLEDFRGFLQDWNHTISGNIFRRKTVILRRLAGIYKVLVIGGNDFLSNLESQLRHEYNLLLDQEEHFWHQKSRVQRLRHGDQNSRFFHMTTMTRRWRNKIEGLYDDAGTWHSDMDSLREIAHRYFTALYTACPPCHLIDLSDLQSGALSPFELSELNCFPTLQDIKDALFGIGAYKSPGVDGLPTFFYRSLCSNEISYVIW